MQPEELFSLVFIIGMFTGVFIVYMGLRQRSAQLEMQHKERMAMIERGQIPLAEHVGGQSVRRSGTVAPSSRSLSLGIMVVGLGIAMMTIISIAGESPEVGIGVGGAIAVLGGAFIVRAVLVRPEPEQVLERRPGTLPERPLPPPPEI